MEKASNSSLWIEEGYILFAQEGLQGVHIERLSRILGLNKSGFYYHFGDFECYCVALLDCYQERIEDYLLNIRSINSVDPGYLEILVKHKLTVMFHLQLVQCKSNHPFYTTGHRIAKAIDRREDIIICDTWADFIGVHDNPGLAINYFNIIRDMFYARLSFKDLNIIFLQKIFGEVRTLTKAITKSNAVEASPLVF
ncbi:MAG TPA: TetR/AcrR family transcriptional regulator [Chryseolinea sp.]|nr:TetR/AcrR family transcriptional regulator [Chryseolinea sp.]